MTTAGIAAPYRPLPDNLTIKKSKLHGLGLFSTEFISSGTNLGVTHHVIVSDHFGDELLRTPLGGFINHSDVPNCELLEAGGEYTLHTLKDIKKRKELTLKYRWYEVE
tara:strand:- start:252 stop:575 length:324 start_codon:yes stop_codon:yes gene_type:complete